MPKKKVKREIKCKTIDTSCLKKELRHWRLEGFLVLFLVMIGVATIFHSLVHSQENVVGKASILGSEISCAEPYKLCGDICFHPQFDRCINPSKSFVCRLHESACGAKCFDGLTHWCVYPKTGLVCKISEKACNGFAGCCPP